MASAILKTTTATVVALTISNAALAAYDFESVAENFYTNIELVDNGITATFSNQPGTQFYVQYLGVSGWGSRSVWTGGGAGPCLVNFDKGLSFASLQYGDYGADSDLIYLKAYSGLNATGSLLGDVSFNYGTRSFDTSPPETLSILVGPSESIQSLAFGSVGLNGWNNIYVDNLTVREASVPVPEPFTMGLTALGLGVALKRRRR